MRLGCESCGQPHRCICNQFVTCSVCDREFLPPSDDRDYVYDDWVCSECEDEAEREAEAEAEQQHE